MTIAHCFIPLCLVVLQLKYAQYQSCSTGYQYGLVIQNKKKSLHYKNHHQVNDQCQCDNQESSEDCNTYNALSILLQLKDKNTYQQNNIYVSTKVINNMFSLYVCYSEEDNLISTRKSYANFYKENALPVVIPFQMMYFWHQLVELCSSLR